MANLDDRAADGGGYNDEANRSNRACAARRRGLLTKSEITRDALDHHEGLGVNFDYPVAFARWLIAKEIWQPKEWHHTGYRRRGVQQTDYFDLRDLEAIDKASLKALLPQWKAEKNGRPAGQRVSGSYPVFRRDYRRGAGRNDYRVDHHVEFQGELVGDWIHLDGGGKKKASSKYIEWQID